MQDSSDPLSRLMSAHKPTRDVETRRVLSEVRQRLLDRGSGVEIGRFERLVRIGHGGMGVVYRAWDPLLERAVAIKVLHPVALDSERILAEARALARLTHPNIVNVLDVQREGDEVFVVMEYVEGRTLSEILMRSPSLRELMPLLEQVAQGVSAAHEASIVHHDIKPSNILVSASGVVQLVDFGLARLLEGGRAGALGGTRGFAAPEQIAGTTSDPRSDIFSLTAIVYSTLFGRPPGAQVVLPEHPRIRRSLRRFLARGLAAEPAKRFVSAEAWWRALRGSMQSPVRRSLPALLGVGSCVAAASVFAVASVSRVDAPCNTPTRPWSAETRAAVLARFESLELESDRELVGRFDAAMSRFTTEWSRVHEMACRIEDEQALACAGAQHAAAAEIVSSLQSVAIDDGSVVSDLLEEIPRPTSCLEIEPIPARDLERVADLEADLARANAMNAAGRYEASRELLRSMSLPGEPRRFAPQLAQHAFSLATALKLSGEFAAAVTEYEKAYLLYMLGGREDVAARSAAMVAELLANELSDPVGCKRWIRSAEAAIARRPDASDEARGRVAMSLAATYYELGEIDDAAGAYDEAAALLDDERTRPGLLLLSGAIRHAQGDTEGAMRAQTEAIALTRASLGDRHPRLVAYLHNLALLYEETGDAERARALFEEALELSDEAYGPEHASSARLRLAVGVMCVGDRPASACTPILERGLRDLSAVVGPTHIELNIGRQGLAEAYLDAGELEEAERTILGALDAAEQPEVLPARLRAGVFMTHARILREQGRFEGGLVASRRALSTLVDALGREHMLAAVVLEEVGRGLVATGSEDEARAVFERAVTIARDNYGPTHETTARIQQQLDGLAPL